MNGPAVTVRSGGTGSTSGAFAASIRVTRPTAATGILVSTDRS
jgi:hypothetical protein